MKILKIYPEKDHPGRYNYHINYGAWDEVEGDRVSLEGFNKDVTQYDIVFLPMFGRWTKHGDLLKRIKDSPKVKKVLFDNDSCYRRFTDSFYNGFDFIFYRDLDRTRKTPSSAPSDRLLWSVDPSMYPAKYGGTGVTFNCTVGKTYKLRKEIAKKITPIKVSGKAYIENLQNHAGAIHTNSEILPMVRAKILEIASCGTQIISNPSQYMDYYFEDSLITYFETVPELVNLVKEFKPDINIQKQLRETVEDLHTNKLRAKFIIETLEKVV
jgi:hypothetical protein